MFGGDGTNNPAAFKLPGSYVSNFAPDISGIKGNAARIAGWKKDNPKASLGSFGPPTYLATQIEMMAIRKACDAGGGTLKNRASVLKYIRGIVVPNSILGARSGSEDEQRAPVNPRFYIFQIQKNSTHTHTAGADFVNSRASTSVAARRIAGPPWNPPSAARFKFAARVDTFDSLPRR